MLQKSSMLRTVEVFFKKPTKKHNLMDISRDIGLAHTSVKKSLDKLVKENIIAESIEKKGKRKFPLYQANYSESHFRNSKKIHNLDSLLQSGVIRFLEGTLTPKSIVLFGSYARGEDTEESDIDLFIECKKEEISLEKFEKLLGRKIELHFNEHFASYPSELRNNIINGVVLSGFLEVF